MKGEKSKVSLYIITTKEQTPKILYWGYDHQEAKKIKSSSNNIEVWDHGEVVFNEKDPRDGDNDYLSKYFYS